MKESRQPAAQPSHGSSIGTAALLLMLGTILSRILGLVREQVTSYLFGTGDSVAAFTIADNIHTMLFDLVISGMMQAALIPVLSEYATPERREEFRRITGSLLTLAFISVGSIVVLIEIFAPTAVTIMTRIGADTTFRSEETYQLTIELVRMILPAVLMLAISTILMAALYSLNRFARPALSLSVRNLAIVTAALSLGHTSVGIHSLVIGIVLGAILLIGVLLPGLHDMMPVPNFHFRHPAIKRIYLLYLPIFIGLLFNTAALIVDRNLAWRAGENALGAMRYATTLNQMILGLVAAAISLAALPTLSRHFTNNDEVAYRSTLARGLRMVTVLVVPAFLGMLVLSWPIVRLLFFHGETQQAGADAIWLALMLYLPGTLFAAFDQVLIFAFYARQNTKAPQIVGVLAVFVYFAFALSLFGSLDMAGLVIANSIQFIFHTIVMIILARRLLAGASLDGGRLRRTFLACLSVGLIMAAIAGGVAFGLESILTAGLIRDVAVVLIPTAIGALVYVVGLALLDVEEIEIIQRRFFAIAGRSR